MEMISVSKGCFVPSSDRSNKKRKVDDCFEAFENEPWYSSYKKIWKPLENQLKELNEDISSKLIEDIVEFIRTYKVTDQSIPAVTVFTGINLPDHESLYDTISKKLKANLNCFISKIENSNSTTLKNLVENLVSNFISSNSNITVTDEEMDLEDIEFEESENSLRKYHCTFPRLLKWYKETAGRSLEKFDFNKSNHEVNLPTLIIIIPDVESYSGKALEDFITILNVYNDRLPIVLILGIATTLSAIRNLFPYNVLSMLSIHLFQSQPSVVFLNSFLESVFLTSSCPFQLGGRVFQFLTDVFLFYNFSVKQFIRGIQFCMLNHFYCSEIAILCCPSSKIPKAVSALNVNQIRNLLQIPSMIRHNELRRKSNLKPLEESKNIKAELETLLKNLHEHVTRFHLAVRCLNMLVKNLPQTPLGIHVREIYTEAMSTEIIKTDKFKTCFELLNFLSKDELLLKLEGVIGVLSKVASDRLITELLNTCRDHHTYVKLAGLKKLSNKSPSKSPRKLDLSVNNRAQLKKKLFENVGAEKHRTEFEKARKETLDFLQHKFFEQCLRRPTTMPLHETLIYQDVALARRHIVGVPRASLHTALTDCHHYLQCDCCSSADKRGILKFLPDICVAYKLHLECGTLINIYDWLQSFSLIVDSEKSEDEEVGRETQARFTQAITELQFLGFIKPSTKKLDHVEKLTF